MRASFLLLAAVVGCDPLTVLGVEEEVRERDTVEAPPPIADDRIEDKHPVYDPSALVEETVDGCAVRWNKSGSIVKLDVLPFDAATRALETQVFPGWTAAARALAGKKVLPSMEVVQGLLKPFNDGLYAAVELGAENGSNGALVHKRGLFRDVLAALVARAGDPAVDEAAATFAAAMEMSGDTPTAPTSVLSRASSLISSFDAQPLASRPIGFYAWSSELSNVFRRDRFLQGWAIETGFGPTAQTAFTVRGDGDLRARYQRTLDLYAGMTGPYRDVSPIAIAELLDGGASTALGPLEAATRAKYPALGASAACASTFAMLPRSEVAESRLFRTLFCDKVLPEGTNLLDVLIGQIRLGKLDLTPRAGAGWSDRQLWALETLLVPDRAPEKDHLFLTKRYKEKLIETFKLIVTQTRETHVKQTEIGGSMAVSATIEPRPIDLHPNLPVEPFPTFYLRTARAYRFVDNLLRATMGPEWLASARRMKEDGSFAGESLAVELRNVEELLYGLHVLSARAIGMKPQLGVDDLEASESVIARASTFTQRFAEDPDVARDPRVIVPVMVDPERRQVHYWAVIGVRALRIRAEFYPGFEPKDLTFRDNCVFRSWVPQEPFILIGKTIEIVLPSTRPPPTRDELRRACDASTDPEAIRTALSR